MHLNGASASVPISICNSHLSLLLVTVIAYETDRPLRNPSGIKEDGRANTAEVDSESATDCCNTQGTVLAKPCRGRCCACAKRDGSAVTSASVGGLAN